MPHYAARVRRVAVLVGIAGVPLLFTRFSNDPFNLPKLALLLAVAGLATAALSAEVLQGVRFPAITEMRIPALVLAIPLLLATVASPYRWWSLFGEYQRFQGLIPHLLVIGLGLLVATTFAGQPRTPAHWLTLAGAIAGGYSILQFLGIDLFEWGQQFGGEVEVTSTLGNTNFSGGFLAICLPVAAVLLIEERTPKRLFVGGLIAGGVLVSFSQGAWVASAAGVVFAAGLYYSDRIRWGAVAGAVLAALLAIASLGYVVKGIIEADDQGGSNTVQLRSWWWESAIDMTLDYPIVGHGPNSYAVDSWDYRPVEESSVQGFDYTNDPHSGYLAMSTGAGLLGLGGLLFVLGWAVRRAWVNRNVFLVAGAGGGVVAYAVDIITTVDELSLRVGLWVCIGLLVAATVAAPEKTASTGKTSKSKKRVQAKAVPLAKPWVVVACALAAILVTGYSIALVFADTQIRHGVQAFRAGELDEARSRFDSALSVWPSNAHKHTYAFFLGELAYSREDEDLLEESLDAYSYLDGFPDVAGLLDRGRTLTKFSEFEPAYLELSADSYLRAARIDEHNVALIPEAVDVLVRAERFEDAIEVADRAIVVLGERAPSLWIALARSYYEMGDEAQAKEALAKAEEFLPEDPAVLELAEDLR